MFFNYLLKITQNCLKKIYLKSFILKKLDFFIALNIFLVIFSSIFAQSDYIGYFAMFGIILTIIKLFVTPNDKINLSRGDFLLLLYLVVVIISVAGSSLFLLSLKGFLKTFIYIGYYATVVKYLCNNRKMIFYILLSIAIAGFCETFIAFYQNFISVEEISGWQDVTNLNPEQVMTRVYGTLKPYNPNLFGGYMLSVLPATLLLIVLPIMNGHKKFALAGSIPFFMIIISIILTGCRGAYVGLFIGLCLLALFTYRWLLPMYKKIYLGILAGISALGMLLIVSIPALCRRVFSIFIMRGDSSNSFRFNVYHSCLQMFKDNFLLGIGVGNQNFREVYGLYMRTGFDALSAYNIYLETALESGIFALLFFIGFITYNLIVAVKYILKKFNRNSLFLLIAVISIISVLVHGFVDTVFYRPQLQFVFWTMVAIIRVITTGSGRLLLKRKYKFV